MELLKLVESSREFFSSKATMDVEVRIKYLKKLYQEIKDNESKILEALGKDLGKSGYEGYMTEVGMCLSELSYVISNCKKWAKPRSVKTSLEQFHARSMIVSNPLGVVLIMSPWNYPFMLTMEPLFGALAAGNCCIIKPSAYSKHTSEVIKDLISQVFPKEMVSVVSGGRKENEELLDIKFDFIFFTGSVFVGKLVMEKASRHLTPVTLELGGKSPCIVDETANLKVAAKRIVFGKFLNCGQTCVAPDYVLVHESVKEQFLLFVKEEIKNTYTKDPLNSTLYGKIINEKHYERLLSLIDQEKVVYGGKHDSLKLKIEPTVLDNVQLDDDIMKEEIFGPIMPILTFKNYEDTDKIIKQFDKPLAAYLFSNDKTRQQDFLYQLPFGGGCLNDTIVHLASSRMPFGGVGSSGMGKYHGIESFKTFSHEKSILQRYNWIDLPFRYQPYKKSYDKIIRFFMK